MPKETPRLAPTVPPGIALFLRALVTADTGGLADWMAGHPDDAAWSTWLLQQGLAPYAYVQLCRAGLNGYLTPAVQTAFRQAYVQALAHAELRRRELLAVLDALVAKGIVPALFKGAFLAHTVYPTPACRPMGDLDLWITADEMSDAQAALEEIGYVRRIKATRPPAFQAWRGGEVQMVGRRAGQGLVELHWGAFAGEWLYRAGQIDESGVRARLEPIRICDRPGLTLAVEDAIIHLAVHLAINHQLAYPGVRGLLDIALVAHGRPVDWATVAERAIHWRVAAVTWLVLRLTGELFGLDDARSALDVLAPGALRCRALAPFANGTSLLTGRDITRTPLRFVYQLLLVDRPADAVRLFLSALWPEDDWLAARYGRQGPLVRLIHFAGALRGRV